MAVSSRTMNEISLEKCFECIGVSEMWKTNIMDLRDVFFESTDLEDDKLAAPIEPPSLYIQDDNFNKILADFEPHDPHELDSFIADPPSAVPLSTPQLKSRSRCWTEEGSRSVNIKPTESSFSIGVWDPATVIPSETSLASEVPSDNKPFAKPRQSFLDVSNAQPLFRPKHERSSRKYENPTNQCCNFCRNNGEPEYVFSRHPLRDRYGRALCPLLRNYRCPICGATGDNSHTTKYCPKKRIFTMEDLNMVNRF